MNILFLLLAATLSGRAAAVPAIRWEPFVLPQEIAGLDAQLGRMTVPLWRAHPESGSVELAFVRLRTAGSMHLIVPNAGHEDLEPNEEVQAAIADYFAGKDVASRRIALPVPDFRSVAEAKRERRLE